MTVIIFKWYRSRVLNLVKRLVCDDFQCCFFALLNSFKTHILIFYRDSLVNAMEINLYSIKSDYKFLQSDLVKLIKKKVDAITIW